jgi:hypothetical protein
MASSVSSEQAFLSAGITISKRRNRLKPDVVEALQCLKFMIKWDLFFQFDPSIAADEMQEEEEEAALGLDSEVSDKNGKSWDEMWIVDNDDDEVEGVLDGVAEGGSTNAMRRVGRTGGGGEPILTSSAYSSDAAESLPAAEGGAESTSMRIGAEAGRGG